MRIVLAEQLNGQQLERSFDSTSFVVGRDDIECQIVFDSEKWPMVSRRHAEFRFEAGRYVLVDSSSRFGTFVDGERVSEPIEMRAGTVVQFGPNGPSLRVLKVESVSGPHRAEENVTSASGLDAVSLLITGRFAQTSGEALSVVKLRDDRPVTIGRAADNDIQLEELQISNHHARVSKAQTNVFIEDAGSTNGVYVNGTRIKQKTLLSENDNVQIGPFLLRVDDLHVEVFDTRSKTRIDAIDITKVVKNRSGGGETKLLDDVDLSIEPNEFVGLLGPSGAGKSTLMDALNGMRPATDGVVLVNNQDLYEQLDSLKQSIGYVPQDDIIHRELSVYRTLYYVARLRLSRDVSAAEIDQIINEVMDVTGLSERRDVPVGQLSGGQRKRVSIAVELITKPSVIFLDEPTSGLDPATEEKIMKLFRHIAESGRTVILTTHAMENVKLFDKIVVLMRGKLVFYGAPAEALAHVDAESFKDLYDKLEEPLEEQLAKLPPLSAKASTVQQREYKRQKEQIAEAVAEAWKQRFLGTEQYRENILKPLGALKGRTHAAVPAKHRPVVTDALRQWKTLARRYIEVLRYDKFNLLILFGQAPIVAFLTFVVVDPKSPRDFPYFVLALVSVWFGTSIAAREIIRERAVYNRERMVNLGLFAYVGSKLTVLSLIVGLQCILLFGLLRLLHLSGLMKLPGDESGLPQLAIVLISGVVGIAMGLFVSAIVKTSEMATSLVPLLLIPQIIFCGLVGVPKGASKYVGAIMPATWAFDGLKRWSSDLGVLKGSDEGAMAAKSDEGRGLYKQVEHDNDELIDKKQKEVEDYRAKSEKKFEDFDEEMKDYQKRVEKWNVSGRRGDEPKKPEKPELDPVPPKVEVENIPDDLSGYVDFLHPWGGKWFDAIVLLLMFVGLTFGTIMALRAQDIG